MERHETPSLKGLRTLGRPPEKANAVLESLGRPHVDSFNWMLDEGLALALKHLEPSEFELNGQRLSFRFEDFQLHRPTVRNSMVPLRSVRILPSECRQRGDTYRGLLELRLAWTLGGQPQTPMMLSLGEIPIMVKTKACHLSNMSPSELVACGEEEDCWGGFFLVKGHERLVRMLVATRKNYPVALQRHSWRNRGPLFTDMGIVMRSVSEDLRSVNNVMHFLSDGSVKLMFAHEKMLCFAPIMLMLKALAPHMSDRTVCERVLGGNASLYFRSSVLQQLRQLHEDGVHSAEQALDTLGAAFRSRFRRLPPWYTDAEVAHFLISRCVCIHAEEYEAKFGCLVGMCRKLMSLVEGKCKPESVDAVMAQEALLAGHLYMQVLQDKMQKWLILLKSVITKRSAAKGASYQLTLEELGQCTKRCGTFETSMANFLATGNVTSLTGLGLMQDKGLTIVAENINRMRYMSHFRAIHRGSFFQEMRTTDARQLLPDAWGFICPVHTPDGTPCGLLNHLARGCQVATRPAAVAPVEAALEALGVVGAEEKGDWGVWVEGRVVGWVEPEAARAAAAALRVLKTQEGWEAEICLLEAADGLRGQWPGLFICVGAGRLMRRVLHLPTRRPQLLGTLEQVHLHVAAAPEDLEVAAPDLPPPSHLELSKTNFLSNLACLIPMPDCNQSPRNMYQCQMGKQSMGTPTHAWHLSSETKLYRLQTPAAPLFRTTHYDAVGLDEHAMGVNAVVAVVSYTGYDMEDAMILNRASYERGLAHASIYKSEFIELTANCHFARDPARPELSKTLDADGLPYVGGAINENDPIACSLDLATNEYKVHSFHGKESVHVDNVRLCGAPQTSQRAIIPAKVCLTFRVPRNPTVGDKFASRAGQKGICSQKWPAEDLPFTESGMVPDIVFNPHGFPSRMTIAMMIELMAGKAGSCLGEAYDATPFRFSEGETAIDHFGRLLSACGYSYFGTERMYSGVDGREMQAEVFFGIVHYQRLRHMVSDKWQVRSTGAVDQLTRQPVKGRRRGGGVRFGEMERDALVSHGAAFLLQDRLFHCSDRSQAVCCGACGSVLHVGVGGAGGGGEGAVCRACGAGGLPTTVDVPHSLRYLCAQLASVNINLKLQLSR